MGFFILLVILHLFCFKSKSRILYSLSFIILLFLLFSRELSVGTDTKNYLEHFRYLSMGLSVGTDYLWEKLLMVSSKISSSFHFSLFLSALLTLIPVYVVVWKVMKYPILGIYIYMSFFFYFDAYNMMRQEIAISLVLLCYYFYHSKRLFASLIILLMAVFFHKSAIILFVFYPFYMLVKRIALSNVLYCFLLSFIIGTFFSESILSVAVFVFERYSHYQLSDNSILSIINLLFYNLFFGVLIYSSKSKNILVYVLFTFVVFYNIFYRIPYANRALDYFAIAVVFIPYIVNNTFLSVSNKFFLNVFFVLFCFFRFLLFIYYNVNEIIPYKSIFNI